MVAPPRAPSVMAAPGRRAARRGAIAAVLAAAGVLVAPAFVWPSGERADARRAAAARWTAGRGDGSPVTGPFEPPAASGEAGAGGSPQWWTAAALAAGLVLAAAAPQPAHGQVWKQLMAEREAKRVAKLQAEASEAPSATTPAPSPPAPSAPAPSPSSSSSAKLITDQLYAENRAKVLEDAAALKRKEAFARSAEAAQKGKAERLMRQLDLQRKESERQREAELDSKSQKGKAVLKKLESNAKKAQEKAGTSDADNKPKAWAVFSNFFTNQEEKKKAEEAAIAAKEAKRLKVLQELEERKAKAEKAAQEAEEVAAKIEALAKAAREEALKAQEAAQKALSAGEAQEAAARVAREQAQLAREAAAKALAMQAP